MKIHGSSSLYPLIKGVIHIHIVYTCTDTIECTAICTFTTNGPNRLTWISSASTESEGTETDPMTKLFTSRGAEGRVVGVAPPGVELGGRAVGGSLWTTCMTFP